MLAGSRNVCNTNGASAVLHKEINIYLQIYMQKGEPAARRRTPHTHRGTTDAPTGLKAGARECKPKK